MRSFLFPRYEMNNVTLTRSNVPPANLRMVEERAHASPPHPPKVASRPHRPSDVSTLCETRLVQQPTERHVRERTDTPGTPANIRWPNGGGDEQNSNLKAAIAAATAGERCYGAGAAASNLKSTNYATGSTGSMNDSLSSHRNVGQSSSC